MMVFSRHLRELLYEKRVSVKKLSIETGVGAKTIYHWLNGQHPSNLLYLKKIADYFEISLDCLLFGPRSEGTFKVSKESVEPSVLILGTYEVRIVRKIE